MRLPTTVMMSNAMIIVLSLLFVGCSGDNTEDFDHDPRRDECKHLDNTGKGDQISPCISAFSSSGACTCPGGSDLPGGDGVRSLAIPAEDFDHDPRRDECKNLADSSGKGDQGISAFSSSGACTCPGGSDLPGGDGI